MFEHKFQFLYHHESPTNLTRKRVELSSFKIIILLFILFSLCSCSSDSKTINRWGHIHKNNSGAISSTWIYGGQIIGVDDITIRNGYGISHFNGKEWINYDSTQAIKKWGKDSFLMTEFTIKEIQLLKKIGINKLDVVKSIVVDKNKKIWILAKDTLFVSTLSSIKEVDVSMLPSNNIECLTTDSSGTIWVSGDVIDKKSKAQHKYRDSQKFIASYSDNRWTVEYTDKKTFSIPARYSWHNMSFDNTGTIWFSLKTYGLVTYKNKEWVYFSEVNRKSKQRITSIDKISNPRHAGYEEYKAGLFGEGYDPYNIIPDPETKSAVSLMTSDTVLSLFCDSNRDIWLSTFNEVFKISNGKWIKIELPYMNMPTLRAISEDKSGNILFWGSGYFYNERNHQATNPSHNGVYVLGRNNQWIDLSNKKMGIYSNYVKRAYSYKNRQFFIGLNTLHIKDGDGWEELTLANEPLGEQFNREKRNKVHQSVIRFTADEWEKIVPPKSLFETTASYSGIKAAKDRFGNIYAIIPKNNHFAPELWFGKYDGKEWIQIRCPYPDFSTIASVNSVIVSSDDQVYISTSGCGVFTYRF